MSARYLIGLLSLTIALVSQVSAAPQSLSADIDKLTAAVEPELIQWRRYLHQNPELSNRETETAKMIKRPMTAVSKRLRFTCVSFG